MLNSQPQSTATSTTIIATTSTTTTIIAANKKRGRITIGLFGLLLLLSLCASPQQAAQALADGSQAEQAQSPKPNNETIPPATYELTVISAGSGMVVPASGPYAAGATVEMSAMPEPGWRFVEWGGALSGADSPTTVTMNANKTVTAVFVLIEPERYALTAATDGDGDGSGTIDLMPTGGIYDSGTQVTVNASPRRGSLFTGWSGACSGVESACVVTMDAAKAVTATFALEAFARYKLTTVTNGSGGGTISLSPAGGIYFPGTAVTLNAVADDNSHFVGWAGNWNDGWTDDSVDESDSEQVDEWIIGACGNSQTCTITMSSAKTVTATFGAGAPPPNTAPVAVADYASTAQGRSISIDLLSNDSDADGHALSIGSVSQPGSSQSSDSFGFTSGVVSLVGSEVIFKPAAAFKGTTSFTYLLSDGRGGLDTGTVTVTVVKEVASIQVLESGRTTYNFASTIQANPDDLPPNSPLLNNPLPSTPNPNANLLQYDVQTLINIPDGALTQLPTTGQRLELSFGWLDPIAITKQQLEASPTGLESTLVNFIIDAVVDNVLVQEYAFAIPINVAVAYEDELFHGLDESTMTLRYWDPHGQQWLSNGAYVIQRDPANNIVVISISHLTQFALFAERTVPAALDEDGEPQYSLVPTVYLPMVR